MAITIIKGADGIRNTFIANATLEHGRVVQIGANRQVTLADDTTTKLQGGVVQGDVLSGAVTRVVTHGIASGLRCAGAVVYGALISATSGISGAGSITTWTSGASAGTILGKALNSGGVGSGIAALVALG